MGVLEQSWLSQNQVDGDGHINLDRMKGTTLMRLDIPPFTEYFRNKVSSFQGVNGNEEGRHDQNGGVVELGSPPPPPPPPPPPAPL